MTRSACLRPSHIEVDLDAFAGNLAAIRAHAGVPVMAIVKANAYGHGLVPMAWQAVLSGAAQLGVAFVEEGVALRQAGIRIPILVLGGLFSDQLVRYFANDLEITVPSLDKLRLVVAAAEAHGRRAVVHLKIDTGMQRLGVDSAQAGALIEAACASPWIEVKGVFSHLACADEPDAPMTAQQVERFHQACAHFERIGAPMPIRHLANSAGVVNFPDTWLDMVRPGILLYGVSPGPATPPLPGVRPVLSLKSRVVFFKVIPAGATVSYGATWRAERETRIVTVPIGYGDGWSRALSSRGEVLIGGRRHRIAGRVCMDQFMVDIGEGSAWDEDEVVLIGQQGDDAIRAEEVAGLAGTIGYELLVGLSARLPRRYIGGSAITPR
ncbi:alanine racemase [Luteimonas sp. e5]